VKIDILPSSAVFPTLMRDVGNSLNVSACLATADNDGKGKLVTCWPLLFSPLATMTYLVDGRSIGRPAAFLSFLLMQCPSAPESYVIMTTLVSFISRTVRCGWNHTCFALLMLFSVQLNADLILLVILQPYCHSPTVGAGR
jgi:hypothetical protein